MPNYYGAGLAPYQGLASAGRLALQLGSKGSLGTVGLHSTPRKEEGQGAKLLMQVKISTA